MAGASRVAWREGLFLRPQHFQQQDRFLEQLIETRASTLAPYPWGLTQLKISNEALQLGKFAVERLSAVLPDGTPVATPGDAGAIQPLDVPADTRDAVVHLTLPARQEGALEYQDREEAQAHARNLVDEEEVYDAFSSSRVAEAIELARPNLRFGLTRDQLDGRVTLPLARIVEVQNGKVVLDDSFIPPCLDCRASVRLVGYVDDLIGRADQRVDELALRAVDDSGAGTAALISYLLLQALNRWTPILHHLRSLPGLHPERLYETFVGMAGELATFTTDERRGPDFAPYDHEHLQETFEPVVELLRTELSMLFQDAAGQLPLERIGQAAYAARIDDHSIFQTCNLYLAVSAKAPADVLMKRLPSLVKIGSVVKMPEIVKNALQAGVRISPIATPPPQIRVLPGLVYFELDRGSPDWQDLGSAPALGLNVSGEWPDLRLELWWVKRTR